MVLSSAVPSSAVLSSIFKPVINRFDHFILELDEALLVPPPVVYFKANRVHGNDVNFYRRIPEFMAKNPAGAAGVEQFGGDNNRGRSGLPDPRPNGPGFIVGAGDIGADRQHGGFRDVVDQQN